MKTITTLLLTGFLLAGTCNTVLARNDGRWERSHRHRNEIVIRTTVDRRFERRPNCSIEDLAWMETNRITHTLSLSNHQRKRVFDINYRYLAHRHNGDYYPSERRDREIRRILRLGQIVAFAVLLDELRDYETCCHVHHERY